VCGILGLIVPEKSYVSPALLNLITSTLFKLSESRGKEASGLAIMSKNQITVFKRNISACSLLEHRKYKELFQQRKIGAISQKKKWFFLKPMALIGHSRLVTTGNQEYHHNNQPVIKQGVIGIHNGIIVNYQELWQKYRDIQQEYDVDSEIIFCLIRKFYSESNSLINGVQKTFDLIEGVASIAGIFEDLDYLLLATNNGSLYYCRSTSGKPYVFASERYMLKKLIKKRGLASFFKDYEIQHIKPGRGCLINLKKLDQIDFDLKESVGASEEIGTLNLGRTIVDILPFGESGKAIDESDGIVADVRYSSIESMFPYDEAVFDGIKRCNKCILPYTMPYIEYNEERICNYCRNYSIRVPKGKNFLFELSDRARSKSGEIDCLVGVSGGRDSTYALHYIKKVLKLNPAAYTYDWGLVTDLARRNISRICGKLGVEHILVSADIRKKRDFIRKNVEAWLRKPELGIIPLFMAGDKHYFYYAKKVKQQLGVKLIMFGENMLEKADFKAGFAGGIPENIDEDHVYTMSVINKLRMLFYYGRNFITNSAYLNSSLIDTMTAYACYYLMNRDYVNIYRYIPWIEEKVVSTIVKEYDWELAEDTKATWRIGDGTASFYNYIYYTIAGFTENDAIRSNQIREGMVSRNRALSLVKEENRPRFQSIKWYLDTIGMGWKFEEVLNRINSVPKLYAV
jgi:hypothetical protein